MTLDVDGKDTFLSSVSSTVQSTTCCSVERPDIAPSPHLCESVPAFLGIWMPKDSFPPASSVMWPSPCRVMVKVYNEDRPRPRNIGPQHIGGDVLTEALDALEAGDAVGAAGAFGAAWLEAYGMDAVDASVTDVVGAFELR